MGRIRGFTLIELMVTLAVFAIVAGLAIPSFTQMIRDNRSVALADNLLSAAQYARAQAVTVKGAVSLCASADGATCGADWTEGWIVFADGAAIETATTPQVSEVLRHWEAPWTIASIVVQLTCTDNMFIRITVVGTLA